MCDDIIEEGALKHMPMTQERVDQRLISIIENIVLFDCNAPGEDYDGQPITVKDYNPPSTAELIAQEIQSQYIHKSDVWNMLDGVHKEIKVLKAQADLLKGERG